MRITTAYKDLPHMRKVALIFLLFYSAFSQAQEVLSLENCYKSLRTNYPLIKNSALISEKSNYQLEAINAKRLPQFNLLLQASYQSDVTQIPNGNGIPGVVPPNKDQYKSELHINQLIYSENAIKASENVEKASSKIALQEVEVSIHQLEKQVNQLYFSILLQQTKTQLLLQNINLLNAQLKEVKSGIKNGTILPSSDLIIEVEILKLEQALLETTLTEQQLKESLSNLLGITIDPDTQLSTQTIQQQRSAPMVNPELTLFNLQKEYIEASEDLLSKNNSLKINGFATGGYGNPGLNFLENSFETYYLFGIRLNWNFLDWNANKNMRKSLLVSKNLIDTESEIFNLHAKIALQEQQAEIDKYETLIHTDEHIISLQKKIVDRAQSLLKNGVYLASNYILEVTNLKNAETQLKTHQIQLLLSTANYNSTKGY